MATDKSLRVLVVTADYPPIEGGISTVTVQLSRELARQGLLVTVVAPRMPGCETFDQEEPIRIFRFGGYWMGWLRLLPMLWCARRLIAHNDLVIAMNVAYGGVIGLMARSFFGVPYATLAYGYEFLKFARFRPAAMFVRYLYAQSRSVIAISQFTRDELIKFGVPGGKVAVVLPGADREPDVDPDALAIVRQRYPLEGRRIILSVGRMVPRKGHLALVRAMPRVRKRVPNAHLVIIGQGPMISACSRAADRMGVRDHVTFAGRLPDAWVQAFYSLCDVFALPASAGAKGQVEGFGLVCSEAHAHGKPVVAGATGGLPEAVLHNQTGLLVDPSDPEAIADALVTVLADANVALHLGEYGRQRVERELNWRQFTSKMLAVLGIR